ncbi:hypothetical protein [Hyphomicrobium sp. MC8b]|uniref:hypothetical protein n=1 Tax=Hyphomicrobium sp. MC8b TaxID=300273 RepID=UPI00391ADD80
MKLTRFQLCWSAVLLGTSLEWVACRYEVPELQPLWAFAALASLLPLLLHRRAGGLR